MSCFLAWFPNASTVCLTSMLKRTNQISQSLKSSLWMMVTLFSLVVEPVVVRPVFPSSSSSASDPGFQQTMEFSQDLDSTKRPNQRQQST